jgi:hypothetical protein
VHSAATVVVKGQSRGILGRNSLYENPTGRVLFSSMPKKHGKMVTFWLRPETASLVEQCMEGDVFPSLSEFFETVLIVFQEHSLALLTCIQQEEAKGFTHKEIFGLLKAEITFRRLKS